MKSPTQSRQYRAQYYKNNNYYTPYTQTHYHTSAPPPNITRSYNKTPAFDIGTQGPQLHEIDKLY